MFAPILESKQRIFAMVLRYFYLIRTSWLRIIEIAYFPVLQVLLWGFISTYLRDQTNLHFSIMGALISAVLLFEILVRGQVGLSLSFLEEIWSRNIGNLLITPLKNWEWVSSLILISLMRTFIAFTPAAILAALFYHFNIFTLGLPLMTFFLNMFILGWTIGFLVNTLILRFGQGVQSLAWTLVFFIAPLSAVYYPVSVLPESLQTVSYLLPTTYVFEGMRQVITDGTFNTDYFIKALLLNLVYFALSIILFFRVIKQAKERGMLLQMGE